MIPIQTEDLRVTERDFLRYSPDSQSNPLGLPLYTEARDLWIWNVLSLYIPISNASVKPPLQSTEHDHHLKAKQNCHWDARLAVAQTRGGIWRDTHQICQLGPSTMA